MSDNVALYRSLQSRIVSDKTENCRSHEIFGLFQRIRVRHQVRHKSGLRADDRAVVRFLSQRSPDVLAEFENIAQTVSLEK
jgi:hypothetical protein